MADHKTGLLQKPPTSDDLRVIADWFGSQAAHSKEDADHWGHRMRAEACQWAAEEIERLRAAAENNLAVMRRAKLWAEQVSDAAIASEDVRAVYAFDMSAICRSIEAGEEANG